MSADRPSDRQLVERRRHVRVAASSVARGEARQGVGWSGGFGRMIASKRERCAVEQYMAPSTRMWQLGLGGSRHRCGRRPRILSCTGLLDRWRRNRWSSAQVAAQATHDCRRLRRHTGRTRPRPATTRLRATPWRGRALACRRGNAAEHGRSFGREQTHGNFSAAQDASTHLWIRISANFSGVQCAMCEPVVLRIKRV